jgi:hypothetical protein
MTNALFFVALALVFVFGFRISLTFSLSHFLIASAEAKGEGGPSGFMSLRPEDDALRFETCWCCQTSLTGRVSCSGLHLCLSLSLSSSFRISLTFSLSHVLIASAEAKGEGGPSGFLSLRPEDDALRFEVETC